MLSDEFPEIGARSPQAIGGGAERNSAKRPVVAKSAVSPVSLKSHEAPHTRLFHSSLQRIRKVNDWLADDAVSCEPLSVPNYAFLPIKNGPLTENRLTSRGG